MTAKTFENPARMAEQPVWARMRQTERRQWRLWASVILVTLLLTGGIVSFGFSFLFPGSDPEYTFNLHLALRGLIGLVLLFDLYVVYQQIQIYRIRKDFSESLEIFRIIGQNADDLIAVVDTEGRRIYNSPAYEKVLGYSLEELKATPSLQQVHADDRALVTQAFDQVVHTGVGRRIEYRFLHKNGSWRVLESTASAVRDAHGQTEKVVIVNRDITERKRAEEMLRQKEEQLRQAQKMEAIGRLSGGIAHDFNNLLSVIIGYGEVLEENMPREGSLHKSVHEIKMAGQRAASLTRQLLAFSRQQILQPRVLDLNKVVREMGELLRRLIGADIELCASLDPRLGRVRADQSQIEQVIMNLAVNARDAMPEGGRLRIETSNITLDDNAASEFHDLQTGSYVLLKVSDTGTGMDAETQRHIFDPFFTTKEKGKGTGLGLAMVYGVVHQSGGHIQVQSAPGEGAKFSIYLPRAGAAVEADAVIQPARQFGRAEETVLLVEDEDALRTLLCEQLRHAGYHVLAAKDGAEAIQLAASCAGPIHLLLTDLVMPGMGGSTLATQLVATRPDLRVLYMSGYLDRDTSAQRSLPSGIPFLQKPFSRETLLRVVREAVAPAVVASM